MEETDGGRFGIVGWGRKLRQFAEDVRRRQRIRLALRSHDPRTAPGTAQFGCCSRRCSRFDGPLLPSSGGGRRPAEAATLPALPGPAAARRRWRADSFGPPRRRAGRLVRQPHFHLVAAAQPSSVPSGIESPAQRRQFGVGRTQFLGRRFGGHHVSALSGQQQQQQRQPGRFVLIKISFFVHQRVYINTARGPFRPFCFYFLFLPIANFCAFPSPSLF